MSSRRLPLPKSDEAFHHRGKWWHRAESGKIVCDLCPRACELKSGQRGFCYIRKADDDGMVLTSYGRSSGFCVDPIEKKPLNHFYPGTTIFSFGTVGCNLGCQFCQNWNISKVRKQDPLQSAASPEQVAKIAKEQGCKSVAFTYNDPVIFAEYAIDTAKACHEMGIKTVAVTAGYIGEAAREEFFAHMDAVNVDLKAFTEEFYEKNSLARLAPVLDTLKYIVHKADTWLELTTLLIPGENDSEEELKAMTEWVVKELGPDVPMHFTAFHPDFRMKDKTATPKETLIRARDIALKAGVKYVYTGNILNAETASTYCPKCNELLIERHWHRIGKLALDHGKCHNCGYAIAGRFYDQKAGVS